MQKTIYISDNDKNLFAKAQELLGERNVSATIVSSLRYVIAHRGEEPSVFDLTAEGHLPIKLYGKELRIQHTEKKADKFPIFRAFKTKSGKIMIHQQTESTSTLLPYENSKDFTRRGRTELSNFPILFTNIRQAIMEDEIVEIID